MKRYYTLVLVVIVAIFVYSCGKEEQVDQTKYPTVDESKLKGVVRTNLDSPEPTAAQLERKKKSIRQVKAMGLPFIEGLPVVEDEHQIKPRTAEEVASRCIAVVLCAIKGETQGKDQPFIDGLVKRFAAEEYFSPEEAKFIKNPSPERQDLIDFSWRYECVHVFLWALGHIDKLKPANTICDVAHDVGLIRDAGPQAFVSKAKLRPLGEILDMADIYYRLHWAATELRINGKKSDKIDGGIIRERHRALNWLIRYMNQEWDDVTTDT
jgi:hypothetical protein